ncbi:MAG: hypothetical protein RQ761_05230 [Bacteroidales bacterium]|nr:hypothetical protein [Bacteroidales bacterium]
MAKSDLSKNLSSVTDVMKDYLQAKLDIFKLDLLQRSTRAGVFLFTFITVLFSVFAVAIFLMFSFSFWYGARTGNLSQGFLISAAVFLLVLIVVFLFRKAIIGRSIIKNISKILFSDDDD